MSRLPSCLMKVELGLREEQPLAQGCTAKQGCQAYRRAGGSGDCPHPPANAPGSASRKSPASLPRGPEFWGKSTAGSSGSCSSWAWPGARGAVFAQVGPDSLWNGLRLARDTGGRAARAVSLHSSSAYYVPSAAAGLGDSPGNETDRGPCSCGACMSVEDRQDTRAVVREEIVS